MFRIFDTPAADKGEWKKFGVDSDTGKKLEACIRTIPTNTEKEIRRRLGVSKTIVKGNKMTIDGEQNREHMLERAVVALVDTRGGWTVFAGEQSVADRYSEALGVKVGVGDSVVLDGKWTEPVKRAFLYDRFEVVGFVVSTVDKSQQEAADEQEKLSGN
jgi:hypothetical protein